MKTKNAKETDIKFYKSQHFRDLVFFGFRYCLERRTAAHTLYISTIKKYWHNFNDYEKDIIKREIRYAFEFEFPPDKCWKKVFEWK